jgi:hypothetical protein
MASTPTDPGTPGGSDPGAGRGGPGYGAYTAMGRDIARMPIPGNAEFLFFVVAMILLAIIAAIADRFDIVGWVDVFKWLGSAYLLSRGIAKASRVLEQ